MRDTIGVHTSAEIARLIAIHQQVAPHRVPLLQACYWRTLSLLELTRESRAPVKQMDRTGLPGIVVIGDDDGFDTGPSAWVAAPRLAKWARLGFIHATGATIESYNWAVAETVQHRKVVLVETGTAHVLAWHRLFANAGIPTINLVPTNGGAHPVSAAPGEIN